MLICVSVAIHIGIWYWFTKWILVSKWIFSRLIVWCIPMWVTRIILISLHAHSLPSSLISLADSKILVFVIFSHVILIVRLFVHNVGVLSGEIIPVTRCELLMACCNVTAFISHHSPHTRLLLSMYDTLHFLMSSLTPSHQYGYHPCLRWICLSPVMLEDLSLVCCGMHICRHKSPSHVILMCICISFPKFVWLLFCEEFITLDLPWLYTGINCSGLEPYVLFCACMKYIGLLSSGLWSIVTIPCCLNSFVCDLPGCIMPMYPLCVTGLWYLLHWCVFWFRKYAGLWPTHWCVDPNMHLACHPPQDVPHKSPCEEHFRKASDPQTFSALTFVK